MQNCLKHFGYGSHELLEQLIIFLQPINYTVQRFGRIEGFLTKSSTYEYVHQVFMSLYHTSNLEHDCHLQFELSY